MCTVTFSKKTLRELKVELQKAYGRGDLRAVRSLSVLVMIGERMKMAVWNVTGQTVYNWLREFVRARWERSGS